MTPTWQLDNAVVPLSLGGALNGSTSLAFIAPDSHQSLAMDVFQIDAMCCRFQEFVQHYGPHHSTATTFIRDAMIPFDIMESLEPHLQILHPQAMSFDDRTRRVLEHNEAIRELSEYFQRSNKRRFTLMVGESFLIIETCQSSQTSRW